MLKFCKLKKYITIYSWKTISINIKKVQSFILLTLMYNEDTEFKDKADQLRNSQCRVVKAFVGDEHFEVEDIEAWL